MTAPRGEMPIPRVTGPTIPAPPDPKCATVNDHACVRRQRPKPKKAPKATCRREESRTHRPKEREKNAGDRAHHAVEEHAKRPRAPNVFWTTLSSLFFFVFCTNAHRLRSFLFSHVFFLCRLLVATTLFFLFERV
nr:hypothetical protein [Pandoravirus massiliensis]